MNLKEGLLLSDVKHDSSTFLYIYEPNISKDI